MDKIEFGDSIYRIGEEVEIELDMHAKVESITIKHGNQIYYNVYWIIAGGGLQCNEVHHSELPKRIKNEYERNAKKAGFWSKDHT